MAAKAAMRVHFINRAHYRTATIFPFSMEQSPT
jgi:hypothetical protein